MIGIFKPSIRLRIKLNSILKRIQKGYDISFKEMYPEFEIGKDTYGNPEVFRWDKKNKLKVGAFCSIAGGVKIFLGGEHRSDWVTTYPFNLRHPAGKGITGHPMSRGDVIIGNDVWIGHSAVILSGVKIGDGAVIGANAVVSKDVGPYEIVAGNPAKLIRKRFSEEIIDELLQIKWWNWDEEIIENMIPFLLSDNINEFISKAKEISTTEFMP